MRSKGTILVVDDNESIKELLRNFLIDNGFTVITASDATLALAKIKQINFDLIISDIMMPGISGIDLLLQIRKIDEDIPVVMITGFPTIDTAVKVIKEGANDFITKPFNLDHAKLVINKAIESGKLKRQNKILTDKAKEVDKIKDISRDLQTKVDELSALYTISDVFHHTYTTGDVLEKTVEMALSVTESQKAAIWIYDKVEQELVLYSGKGMLLNAGTRVAMENAGIISELFIEKEHVLSQDYPTCLCGTDNVQMKHPLLCVPIRISNDIFAALQICMKIGGANFTTKDVSLSKDLSQKTSLRLENLALYENLTDNFFKSITTLVTAIDARDNYTMNHCNRVTEYALKLAKALGLSEDIYDAFRFAGPVHDVGKIGVRDDILLKPGRLDDEERELMNSHVTIGDTIVSHLNMGPNERAIIRNHHERFDGTGYPDKLKHDGIPLTSRIFSVVDTYDAMTTNRPYRSALEPSRAIEELVRCSGSQFDGDLVDVFVGLDVKPIKKENV